ncbi:hypothetical protein [Mesorhizobium sp. M0772]|uniref:hypothetical protein n=2 Tax=Mesorhizobium TaxID=68287 RepID=UPI0033372F65
MAMPGPATMLESLLLGWPEHPRLEALLRDARSSISAPLRLVGIAGLAARGETPAETRDEVLELCGFWSGLDYADRPLALHLLIKYWKDDETLITGAVDMLEQRQYPSVWEFTDAKAYLLHCSTDQHKVRQWLQRELEKPRSINIIGLDNVWTRVGLFAKDDPRLLEPAIASWNQPELRMMHLREIVGFVQSVRDSRIRDILIDVVRGKEDFQKHWAAKALVTAWGRDDPAVAGLFDEILSWPAERLINLAAVLPDIDPDRRACRQRLLDLSRDPLVRRDLLAVGLEACGCDGSDDAAVQALLQPSQRSVYSPMAVLGRSFNTHSDVRALAGTSLKAPEQPWVVLATGFGDEPEVREALLRAAAPLPLELRTVIAETAVAGGVGTSLGSTLQHYELESDPELMVRLSIAYHRALVAGGRQADAIPKLEAELLTYGSDLEPLRAAALAGATIIGELTRVAGLEEQGRLANIVFTTALHPLPSMVRLVSEQWQSFRAAFGDTLEERLKTFSENGVKHTLAYGAALSEAASSEFLASAEAGTMARNPTALRTLAMLRPASPLLLTRCLEALDLEHGRNDYMTVKAEIALILAEQFGGDAAVRDQLVERMRHSHSSASVLALALHSPGDPALAALPEIRVPQRELGQWATIVHIAASFASATEFAQLVETLVTRSRRIQFDAQKISNLGIERRLRRDPEVAELLGRMVDPKAHPSILASIPRYLAATGTLGEKERAKVLDALGMFARDQIVPLAGYDAVADRVRSVRLSMLDALHSGAEI